MPVSFPQYDAETDTLIPRDYFTVAEVAEMLHVSQSFVHQRCREGVWDRLRVQQRYFLSAAQIGEAVEEMQTHNLPADDGTSEPVQLGVPVPDADLESLR